MQDDDTAMEELARTMLCTAARLLRPANEDSVCGAGVCVFVYTPRYRGMGPAIRRACASLGLAMGSINRQSILSPEQAACGKFFSIRTVVVSAHEAAVRAFIGSLAPGGESDDEDWFNEEDADPLASVCTDVFA